MTAICNPFRPHLIRLYELYSLIFFVACGSAACQHRESRSAPGSGLTIRWAGRRATGLLLPNRVAKSGAADSLTVRLAGKETAILGDFRSTGDSILFTPLIPFTRGLRYAVWLGNSAVGEITIPNAAAGDSPTLLAIYPSADSLPDNLLKIYLHFSRPMREGQSLRYVTILKNRTDTLPDVFLDLQPELWNPDRTLLTLWLDPGRIKRDLQPNKQLGQPLQTGADYQLIVSAAWPDAQGAALGKPTIKTFFAGQRDSLSPVPARWTIHSPPAGGLQPLDVAFGEPLDYSLLTAALHVIDGVGERVSGTWQPVDRETRSRFTPSRAWQPGQYTLQIEGRLEDLAGNNLHHPFDRDLTQPTPAATSAKSFAAVRFSVR